MLLLVARVEGVAVVKDLHYRSICQTCYNGVPWAVVVGGSFSSPDVHLCV